MAVSSVGMLGDGITHGRSVWSAYMSRRQPSIATTSSWRADREGVVEQPRQLADGHAVAHRNRELSDERLESRRQPGALRRRCRRWDWDGRRR